MTGKILSFLIDLFYSFVPYLAKNKKFEQGYCCIFVANFELQRYIDFDRIIPKDDKNAVFTFTKQ